MAIRINCPNCKTANTVGDDKRGKRVKCKECETPIGVPEAGAKKRREDEAIQDARKTTIKAGTNGRNRVESC